MQGIWENTTELLGGTNAGPTGREELEVLED